MTMANFTGHWNPSMSLEDLFCMAELTRGVHSQLICIVALNIFLSVTAFLGNALILVALNKESSLHPPTKLLFRCLATTDLLVGLVSEPLVVIRFSFVLNERWVICRYTSLFSFLMGYMLSSVSLFTLTAISVDRLLALLLGLRYRQVVTLKRSFVAAAVFWVVPIVGMAMYFWNNLITLWYGYAIITFCLVSTTFSYTKIFFTLRHRQNQVRHHVHQEQPSHIAALNIARYKKAVSSALWIQLTSGACYLPFGIADALMTQRRVSSSVCIARAFAATLVLLNSSLNPILYCWTIREVRKAVKDTIAEFSLFS